MPEIFTGNWTIILATVILVFASVAVPGMRSVYFAIFRVAASEEVLKWMVIKALEVLVKSTRNKFDDELLAKIKEALQKK